MNSKLRVILIGANTNEKYFLESMIELASLANALDYEVINSYSQNIKEYNTNYYIGEGKAKEIKNNIKDYDCDLIIFNNELTPLQIENLSNLFNLRVIDRTMLILEIFSKRAKTKEAKKQVELASLEYIMPRMVSLNKSFDKQRGGKNKGLGEKYLELDKRKIANKIVSLKKELILIQKQKETMTKKRKDSNIPKICLVGYTNAGKSSLLNTLLELYSVKEDKKVLEKDMLFATLDTSTRSIKVNNKDLIISDTVGFVSMLPHFLIESFKSTLDELISADLLLLVIDSSSPNYLIEKNICLETINEVLKGNEKRIINVYTKCDLPTNNIITGYENDVFISSKTREGINELITLIFNNLYPDLEFLTLFIPYQEISNLYKFESKLFIKSKVEEKNGISIEAFCPKQYFYLCKNYIIDTTRV